MEKMDLNLLILKILEEKYSNADEIIHKLELNQCNLNPKQFYPTLSNLQLEQLLCTHWAENKNGELIKYYHLTKSGFDYLHYSVNVYS